MTSGQYLNELITALWIMGGLIIGGLIYFVIADYFDNDKK